MDQLIMQRLTSIENRLHEINTLQDEGKKWRIILQHWIRKNFDFDVENQMNKPDMLAFYYEPPSVGQILAKNIQVLPQLENIILKQQLEIADYIKKLNSRIVQQSQSQMVHHHHHNSGPSNSRMVPTIMTTQPSHNNTQVLYQHHQIQKNPNLISQISRNQNTFTQNDQQSQPQHRQRIQQQHHNFVQNQQMLKKQQQQQREAAWLQQISRPTGPGPGSSDHGRNISRKNSPQNLGQYSMQLNQRSQNDLSIEEAVGPQRSMQLQRLPVTIEKINVPAPVSLSTPYNHQTSSTDRQRISTAMRNPGVGNRNVSTALSYSSNYQQDAPQSQPQRTNVTPSQNSSVPFAYECQTCQIKFRHKSAAQFHVAKVHSVKQRSPAASTTTTDVLSSTSNSQIHEQSRAPRTMSVTGDIADGDNTMPIIMSVAGGGKRYVRKEQTRHPSVPVSLPVSVPAGLSISMNSDPLLTTANDSNNSTIFPATTAIRNLAAQGQQSLILDEITISDDDEDGVERISSSSVVTALSPPVVGDQIPTDTQHIYSTNDDDDDIVCESVEDSQTMENPRISATVQNNSSPTSSSPVQKSSTSIISRLSSLLSSAAGPKVGEKRSATSTDIPSSPEKRHRSNENLSTGTSVKSPHSVPENLEIVPEINLYTDDDDGYSEFQSPTSAGATITADGVASMDDEIVATTDGLNNNNSIDCQDDNEAIGDNFNDGS